MNCQTIPFAVKEYPNIPSQKLPERFVHYDPPPCTGYFCQYRIYIIATIKVEKRPITTWFVLLSLHQCAIVEEIMR